MAPWLRTLTALQRAGVITHTGQLRSRWNSAPFLAFEGTCIHMVHTQTRSTHTHSQFEMF